jgi:hypothetical protein
LKPGLPEAEVITGYGAKCVRTFSACRQYVSKAEKGLGLGGAIQAGWVWSNEQGSGTTLAEICERLVQAVETSRNEPNANASQVYSDALNRTSEIRKAFSEAKLI